LDDSKQKIGNIDKKDHCQKTRKKGRAVARAGTKQGFKSQPALSTRAISKGNNKMLDQIQQVQYEQDCNAKHCQNLTKKRQKLWITNKPFRASKVTILCSGSHEMS